jgi:glycosyltransferase involved in cell wall biosynthesis
MNWAPRLLYAFMKPVLQHLIRTGFDFDLIDAHYFYPDGVAAVRLGRYFNKPVVVTARGSDLTLLTRYSYPRKMIKWSAEQAAGIVTVSQALKEPLVAMGIPQEKITVLRNGVDLAMFKIPVDRAILRDRIGAKNFTLLCVGNLIPLKGYDLVIKSLVYLSDVNLMIAGSGPEDSRLRELAEKLGVSDRVTFLGVIPHDRLCDYYGAVDLLVLASSREGWPNVLLEAMACGTPVVATAVWGIPEIITKPEAGLLIKSRDSKAIADTVQAMIDNYPDHEATRRYAEEFSWDATTMGQIKLFEDIVNA